MCLDKLRIESEQLGVCLKREVASSWCGDMAAELHTSAAQLPEQKQLKSQGESFCCQFGFSERCKLSQQNLRQHS